MTHDEVGLVPVGGNALVVGSWNMAILNPSGVGRYVLGVPNGTAVQIEVAVNVTRPPRVRHSGLMVVVSPDRLEVTPDAQTAAGMRAACDALRLALDKLPVTPVSAAGVNFRWTTKALPPAIAALVAAPLDQVLADADLPPKAHAVRRTIDLAPGDLNIQVASRPDGSGMVSLNFHCNGNKPEQLRQWLDRVDEFHAISQRVLAAIVGVGAANA